MSTLPGPPTATVTGDAAIRETDNDAAVSRLSAVKAGYLSDPFAAHFVKRASATPRPPLINVGTFVRTWAIDELVQQFLDAEPPRSGTGTDTHPYSRKQIVSLGAGTDSRAFRILDAKRKAGHAANSTALSRSRLARYIEVDFPEATTKKAMLIRQKKDLAELLGDDVTISQGGTALLSPMYALVPGDLRDFASSIAPRLLELLDPALSTLVLAECVFIYLDPAHSESILSWCTSTLGSAGAGVMTVQYDPVGLDDSFGRVMIRNLQTRGLKLLGLPASTSLSGQVERLKRLGFDAAHVQDIRTIRKTILPAVEQERIAKLEMLDEIEELDLLTSHYSVAWAVKPGNLGVLLDVGL